jgi:hypothetical protein
MKCFTILLSSTFPRSLPHPFTFVLHFYTKGNSLLLCDNGNRHVVLLKPFITSTKEFIFCNFHFRRYQHLRRRTWLHASTHLFIELVITLFFIYFLHICFYSSLIVYLSTCLFTSYFTCFCTCLFFCLLATCLLLYVFAICLTCPPPSGRPWFCNQSVSCCLIRHYLVSIRTAKCFTDSSKLFK